MRQFLTAVIALIVPRPFKALFLNLLGHRVGRRVRVGLSILAVEHLYLEDGARVGSFNYIRCRRLSMRSGASVSSFNVIRGPVSVSLAREAALGNRNVVARAPHPVSIGPARLRLDRGAKLTASHTIDCMSSVIIGEYSTVAGKGSQFWTHAYIHESPGPGRVRVDGPIRLGRNVYVGAGCVFSLGVSVADDVTLGCLTPVAKDLDLPGLYVGQPLRRLDKTFAERVQRLEAKPGTAVERVYRKRPGGRI